MSKRRINKQQSGRIEKKHQTYRHLQDDLQDKTLSEGLVIARYSRHAHVESPDKKSLLCAIRPNIESLVAGDRVVWQAEGPSQGIIVSVYPRMTVLSRPDAQGQLRPIAANISQIMIVVAALPPISWVLLDSYLIMAEHLKLQPFIILNKTDLLEATDIRHQLLQIYEPLGYPILFTSSVSDDLAQLQKSLRHQTSVFVGQSGVGKSSLISRILPHEASRIQTGALAKSQFGAHTTSNSFLYHIPSGGELIDSPGVRELSLGAITQPAIAAGYREFKPYISQCKFRNCTHHNTPHCAVISAVKNNQISLKRYENYVKMLAASE